MARPRRDLPLDALSTTDLAVGTGVNSSSLLLLSRLGLIPDFKPVGLGSHRVGTFRTLRHTAMIGALQSAGLEPRLAARIVAPIVVHLDITDRVSTRLDQYLDKGVNPNFPGLPFDHRKDDPDFRDEFWLHHFLTTRTGIYRRGLPILGDFLIEIADLQFVYMDTFDKIDPAKLKKGIHYTADPMFRVTSWERGVDEVEILSINEEAGTLGTPEGDREYERLEVEYMAAYLGAVGRIRINLSLAIRNALDAIHDRRVEQGLISPEIERRDDSPVPSMDLP